MPQDKEVYCSRCGDHLGYIWFNENTPDIICEYCYKKLIKERR